MKNSSFAHSSARLQKGFTLVELTTAASVLAVLMSMAAPGFQQLVTSQRLRSASFDLVSDLVLARSEALKRGATVRVVPNGDSWASGWTVQVTGGTEPLAQRNGLGNGVAVTTAPPSVTFDVNGRVANVDSTVRIGLAGADRKRCISLDPSGRPKSSTTECPL